MLRVFVIAFLIMICCTCLAETTRFGLGIVIGEPTGLSAQYDLGRNHAFNSGLAWSFQKQASIHLHLDYILKNHYIINHDNMPVYYGIGGRVNLARKGKTGLRIPLGVEYSYTDYDLVFFTEIVPMMDLIPKTSFALSAGLGVRYYFK